MKRGSNFNFFIPNPTYYFIDQRFSEKDLYDTAKFCSISQPSPSLSEIRRISLEIPDKIEQENVLFVDNYIYLKFSNGSLNSYEISLNFEKNSIESLKFTQEIAFDGGCNFSQIPLEKSLLFSNFTHQILLVICEKIHIIDINSFSKKSFIRLNRTFLLNSTISHIENYDNFLYIILNFSKIEIYDIRDFFQYSSCFLAELLELPTNSLPFIKDIAINEEYLLILENTTKSCFFLDRLSFSLKNTLFFTNETVYKVELFHETVLIFLMNFDGQLFLKEFIKFSSDSNYYEENNIFEMKSLVKNFEFFPKNLMISVHENLITFIRHSVKFPKNITNLLKKTVANEGIQLLKPAKISGFLQNFSFFEDFLLISNKRELHFMKISIEPGVLSCFPNDSTGTHEYAMNLQLFYFNCSEKEAYCDENGIKTDKIRVILNVYQELFESSNIALAIGLDKTSLYHTCQRNNASRSSKERKM